jgi:hypothetical protein
VALERLGLVQQLVLVEELLLVLAQWAQALELMLAQQQVPVRQLAVEQEE